jgi:hypothetical protein
VRFLLPLFDNFTIVNWKFRMVYVSVELGTPTGISKSLESFAMILVNIV